MNLAGESTRLWLGAWAATFARAAVAGAQQASDLFPPAQGALSAPGWRAGLDPAFLGNSLAALVTAAILGAVIAFHPTTLRAVDTHQEAELPKTYIVYAVIGAVIGVIVLKYGMVVGVVVFGLGGLMRFRSDAGSSRNTGRLILVTLVGLTTGLGLPQFAVVTTAFVFVLIALLDARPICRMVAKDLHEGHVVAAADAYRSALQQAHCRVLSERKSLTKHHVAFLFRAPRTHSSDALHAEVISRVPQELRGIVDWEVE